MTSRTILISFFCMFLHIQLSMGQFGLSGELRFRPEYRRGYKSLAYPDQDPAFFISQRTRIKLSYGMEKLSVFVAFQDVRTWGSTSQLNISDGFLSLHEAWGEVIISEGLRMKAGRQELAYDNHRILGNVDWAQQGRSHDLLLVKFEKERFKWHTGLAFNQAQEQLSTTYYPVANNYKTMQFVWLYAEFEQAKGSILLLNNGMQIDGSTVRFSQTLGTNLNFTPGNMRLNLAGYYQAGRDASNRKISAGYLYAEVSRPLDSGFVPSVGVEYLSGTDQGNILTNNSFAPLYGTNHKFNGFMDYFYVGNHLNSVGLLDPYLTLAYRVDQWTVGGTAHLFSSSARILDPADPGLTMKNYLGTELDLTISFRASDLVTISGGYSHMFATASMQALKGGDHSTTSNWAWLMLSLTPDFLQSNQ